LVETYSTVWPGKHLCDMFPVKNGLKEGDVQFPLLFNFTIECTIRRVQLNQDGLKLISFWFMPMMLIYIERKLVYYKEKHRSFISY